MAAFRKKLVYVYDALCPWCYAFTPVVDDVRRHYADRLDHEVLSGGMVRDDEVKEVGGEDEAARLRESYRSIESITAARFGEAFFNSVAQYVRRLDSLPPATALAAFRMVAPERPQLEFALAVLRRNFWEGDDPNSDEFYRRIALTLHLDPNDFLDVMHSQEALNAAVYDFALARQLGADAFPRLYLQTSEDMLYLVSKGYSDFEQVQRVIEAIGVL